MKDKKTIIILGLLVAPLIISFIYAGTDLIPIPSTQYTESDQIKIMTYNIHFGQGMDDLVNMERIAQNILKEDPDILGLQEVDNGRITSQGINMAYWIAKRLNMHYFYYPAENKHALGCAILSKFQFESSKGYDIPSIHIKRVMVGVTIMLSTDLKIDVFVAHLGLVDEDVLAQVDYVLESIENDADSSTPTLLMGDFNKEPDSEEIQKILTELDDTSAGFSKPPTFPSVDLYGTPEETIDFIFAKGHKTVVNSYVVQDMSDNLEGAIEFGSDHLPLVSILTF